MANDKPVAKDAVDAAIPEVYRRFAEMAQVIPEGADDDANERILRQLMGAETVGDLGNPWDSEGSNKLAGKELEIRTITRRPSDFADGLGIFLVCDAVDVKTGEQIIFTTGSVGIVGQLVKAFCAGWLPLHCKVIQAERPTKAGYYPLHLETYDDFKAK